MTINTFVNFRGNYAEACRYYENHLGAKVGMMMTHGQSPDQIRVSQDWEDVVLHARISIGGTELMASDIPNAEAMRSAYLTLCMENDKAAEQVFSVLVDGGQVLMPTHETFFASRFGQVRNRFGMNWMILHERAMPPQA